MQTEPDEEHFIPVWDCPNCKEEVVLTSSPVYEHKEKKDEEGNPLQVQFWYCPGCDAIPVDESYIKGYCSVQDLLDAGWTTCSLCGGSGEVVNRPTRVIGATGYVVDEQLKPCPVCRAEEASV